MLNTFRSCPRKAELQFIHHWHSSTPSIHLHAGSAFARGLEVARKAFFDEGAPAEDAIAVGLRALVEAYGNVDCPPDHAKSLERVLGAFEYYFSVWPLESDPARPARLASGRHAIEFSFAIPLDIAHPETGDPILFAGRTDQIVQLENGLFVEDDKTASALGASWARQWELRSQFTAYAWAAQKSGLPVDGVLVRGIAIRKTGYDHAQAITFRAPWEIDRWLRQTHRDVERWISLWRAGEYDYSLGEACLEYGGCMFSEICKRSNPEEWLPAYFQKRIWDPLRRIETPGDPQ